MTNNKAVFEDAFELVMKFALDFETNKTFYFSINYQEPEVCKDSIYKFLMVLGWDVNLEKQKKPFHQEVKVERTVTIYNIDLVKIVTGINDAN